MITAIQVEGKKTSSSLGIDGIRIGSKAREAFQKFGKPTERKEAMDDLTNTPIPKVFINIYGDNLSFKEKKGKIISIKISLVASTDDQERPDLASFLNFVKKKNYYRVAELISTNLTVNGKKAALGPILKEVSGKKTLLHDFLFGRNGIKKIRPGDLGDEERRDLKEEGAEGRPGGTQGYVYIFHLGPVNELYFVKSFEGWVLYEAR